MLEVAKYMIESLENFKVDFLLCLIRFHIFSTSQRNLSNISKVIEWTKSLDLPMSYEYGWKGVKITPILGKAPAGR